MEKGTVRVENDYERAWKWNGKRWVIIYAHRACWERYNGPIPAGMIIHHKDGNKKNNSIENLELLTREQHAQVHGDIRRWNAGSAGKKLEEILGPEKAAMVKAKRSAILKGGRTTNPEQARKISEALKGKKKTPEHIQKIADANRGRKWTEEQKQHLKEVRASKPKRVMSEETRRKISEGNLGKKKVRKAKEEGREAPDVSFHYYN